MKRYHKDVEYKLYRLYCARNTVKRLRAQGVPESVVQHGLQLGRSYESSLRRSGLSDEEIERATEDRWLEFEGQGIRDSRLDRCLVNMVTIQARVEAGVYPGNPRLFECNLDDDCIECECFRESTEEQQSNFLHGCDVYTGKPIKAFHDMGGT